MGAEGQEAKRAAQLGKGLSFLGWRGQTLITESAGEVYIQMAQRSGPGHVTEWVMSR